ncbi:DNA gyrase subunit A [Candidatus Fonsibacter ubiquis]|uniref:DNA gyrase subunit A n=1 Tax=Candidatus Fonsibacter ubiquis TaxID=1925548 RepID=UPI000C07551D|nr:DNA gyrase subunit A [Candidatus Fonsibacter ubiquis]
MSEDSNQDISKIKKYNSVQIVDEMKTSYLSYAMSVIISRALPDARDGLKPVHRRIIYAMYKGGYDWSKQFRKSARVVGDVIGKYHPHGDQAVYDALVRLAQDFSMSVKLLDGQGNFGSMDGDRAAAMRYTETRLAKIAEYLVADIEKNTIDYQNNYDDTELEPTVLPAQFPNLLVNGAGGIAVGMATNIPPHNLGEIIDGTLAYIDNNEISIDELIKLIPGPDFPTGGLIIGKDAIKTGYKTGRGSIKIRGEIETEEEKKDKTLVVIKSVPFQTNKSLLIEKIAMLVREKKIEGISDIRDESNKEGVRIVIDLKRGVSSEIIINQLYKYSPIESSFGFNTLAILNGKPELLNLKQFIKIFVEFREKILIKRTLFDLKKAKDRVHILIGLFVAIENIDEIIAIIRKSKNPNDAKTILQSKQWNFKKSKINKDILDVSDLSNKEQYYLSDYQVRAILELRLQKLTAIGHEEINQEISDLYKLIIKYKQILNDRNALLTQIKNELKDIKSKFANARKTKIINKIDNFDIEDVVQKEDVIITITNKGYIKRSPLSSIRVQKRGGKGKTGITTRDEDFVSQIFTANTLTPILFFSSKGIVYKLKAWKIPEGSNQSKGKALQSILPLKEGHVITSIMPLPSDEATWAKMKIMFATAKGKVRKNSLLDFENIQSSGKIAMKLEENDTIVGIKIIEDDDDFLLSTEKGKSLRVQSTKLRLFKGRSSKGIKGISLKKDDKIISLSILKSVKISSDEARAYIKASRLEKDIDEPLEDESEKTKLVKLSKKQIDDFKNKEQYILTITENGFGKRSSAYEYRVSGRGGQGIINIITSERNGLVASTFTINHEDQIMLITDKGQAIRCNVKDIRITGRNTQGVRVFSLAKDEKVVSAARIEDATEENS